MDIEIRVPTAEELHGIFDVRAQAFAVAESDRERWTNLVDPAAMTTAFLGTQVVGSLNVIPLGQWFGGRSVPMGGVATVVVRPEHRGEGIAARLLGARARADARRGDRRQHPAPGDDARVPRGRAGRSAATSPATRIADAVRSSGSRAATPRRSGA